MLRKGNYKYYQYNVSYRLLFIVMFYSNSNVSFFRRLYQRYAVDGRLSEILYDTERVVYSYNPSSYALTSVTLNHPLYDCELRYVTNGTLYDTHTVSIDPSLAHIKFSDVTYKYQYNKFLRISKIEGVLQDGSSRTNFVAEEDYSEATGYVSKINDFQVVRDLYEKKPRVVLSDSTAQFTRVSSLCHLFLQ